MDREAEIAESTPDAGTWTAVLSGALGGILGVIGTVLTAMIHNQSPMAALVDARTRTLISGYEARLADLKAENARLEMKIAMLEEQKK